MYLLSFSEDIIADDFLLPNNLGQILTIFFSLTNRKQSDIINVDKFTHNKRGIKTVNAKRFTNRKWFASNKL